MDYGGVLTTSVTDSFAAFCAREDIELEVFKRVVLGTARGPESPFSKVETGRIDQDEFDREVAQILTDACGRSVDPEGLKLRLFATIGPDSAMIDAVRRARSAGIRTGLVSNSWGGRDAGRGYTHAPLDDLFDAIVISGEVGMRKPDPEIYLFASDKVAVAPDACVFVDDFAVNVEGAERVGMRGIHHRQTEETIAALEEHLEIGLR
jgi:putative hydrolase of the HAD superfamily